MKKALVITSIALVTLTCALIYANSVRTNEATTVGYTADSTRVKPCQHKSDSTKCSQNQHKCNHPEGCKKSGDATCCKNK